MRIDSSIGIATAAGAAFTSSWLTSTANDPREACDSFTFTNITDSTLVKSTYYPSNTLVNITNIAYSVNTNSLPAFCRLEFIVKTSDINNISIAKSEAWLPDEWKKEERFFAFGNGGWSGGVPVGDLAFSGIAYGNVGVGTNTGHDSTSLDGTWAAKNSEERLIDHGWRALHKTVIAGKEIVQEYYGRKNKRSYYSGCSTGGRQGLKSIQAFPDDFDGILIGSPANWITHLQPWSLYLSRLVQPVGSPQWISNQTWSVIAKEVMKQCDSLDGLEDGVITDPRICNFRPENIVCHPGQEDPTTSNCLNPSQINALKKVYSNYYETNMTYIFDRLQPGTELMNGMMGSMTQIPSSIGVDFFRYMVWNDSSWDPITLSYSDIQKADEVNPGQVNAIDPNITSFVRRNGKVLHYVGWADPLISPGNSIHYYDTVATFLGSETDLNIDDSYRLFPIPGMYHCSGGPGAWAIGASGQTQAGGPSTKKDPDHDALIAIMNWVENGVAPKRLIAAKYRDDDDNDGENTEIDPDKMKVAFERPLCPYPQRTRYHPGGDPNSASSFSCA